MIIELNWIENTDNNIKDYGYKRIFIEDSNNNIDYLFDKRIGVIVNINKISLKFDLLKYFYYIKINDGDIIKLDKLTTIINVFNKAFNANIPTFKHFKMFEKIGTIQEDFNEM